LKYEEKTEKHNSVNEIHHEYKESKNHDNAELKNRIKKRLYNIRRDKIALGVLMVVFLTLFIVSFTTKPSLCNDLDCQIDGLSSYSSSLTSASAKDAVNNAIESLESAKTIIDNGTSSPDTTGADTTGASGVGATVASADSTVNVVLINDKRCTKCVASVEQLKASLAQLFPNMNLNEYDYADAEAKTIIQDSEIILLPAILFDSTVESAANYANVQNFLDEAGDYLSLRFEADFDPTAEICDNEIDDTGNGLVDCEDLTCSETLACRTLIENHLAVFVMTDCPYGKEAIKALAPVVEAMPDLDYEINYIVADNGDGTFRSLHGAYEVEEDIRQLCALEEGQDKFLAYALCRSENGVKGVDWNSCADEAGLDKVILEACVTGSKGVELLTENAKIATALGIGASPTWITNNRYKFSGITAEVIQSNVCAYNEGLAGCENIVTSEAAIPAGQC